MNYRLMHLLFIVLSFVLPLILYVVTLSSTYIPVDSAEFALCMHTWGVCHPPGFPLFIFLGKIFMSLFPFGTVIYKANLMSALFGALTIFIIYLTLVRLKVQNLIALLIALFLMVNASFWEYSIAVDIFTFATFLIALTFLFIFYKRYYLAVFTLGLSASHFYISGVLMLIIVWYWLLEGQNASGSENQKIRMPAVQRIRKLVPLLLVFCMGFFPQIVMYFRMQIDPEVNWGHAQGISGFIDFIRRKEFGNIFLIVNPVLKFSIINFFKHLTSYFTNLFTSFGVILPVLIPVSLLFIKFRISARSLLLIFSFLILILVQLFLLSTIDPASSDSPFQINKFYISSFVPLILLIGLAVNVIVKKIFEDEISYPVLFLAFLILIYLVSNFKINNYSGNYFSQNLVLDAMEQLPGNSIAVTVNHIINFGGKYEQLINGRFKDVALLYFPNEKNRDNEYYFPELFKTGTEQDFVEDIKLDKTLGEAESYILSIIGGNLDKDIYILHGTFEEKFFAYLRPYLRPYGLWWKVEADKNAQDDLEQMSLKLKDFRNEGIVFGDLHQKQQQLDSLTYAVSYHSMGVVYASYGKYDKAIEYLNKSESFRPEKSNIQEEIELINYSKDLWEERDELVANSDIEKLSELGHNLFILMNYDGCIEVFGLVIQKKSDDAQALNNIASCYASNGDVLNARNYYQKALNVDPDLEKAKKGLEALDSNY